MAALRSGVSLRMAVASGSHNSRRASAPWPVRARYSASVRPTGGRPNLTARPRRRACQLHAPGHAPAGDAGQQVQGRGQRRTVERGEAAVVHVVELEAGLLLEQIERARAPHQVQRVGVGADHEVRAVVDVLAGGRRRGTTWRGHRGSPAARGAAPRGAAPAGRRPRPAPRSRPPPRLLSRPAAPPERAQGDPHLARARHPHARAEGDGPAAPPRPAARGRWRP